MLRPVLLFALIAPGMALHARAPGAPIAIVSSEFVYESAPYPSAHASTIVETGDALVAAWFGGTRERHPDVGIWVARRSADGWSTPVEVANGVQADGTRHPTWNPVLFEPEGGPLLLFYKVGPSPSEWWGRVMASDDGGRSWSRSARLPDGILGPVRAKPVALEAGTFLAGSSTEHDGWIVHMERFTTPAAADARAAEWVAWLATEKAWTKSAPLNDKDEFGAIQPTILIHSPSRLQILCRSRQDVITEAWSEDGGRTWGPMRRTTLPNPSAGIDAVRLGDGRFALVYNPSPDNRRTVAVAISPDGRQWSAPFAVEEGPGEYSYPALIVSKDGRLHLTYTWRRKKIRHAVLTIQ